MSTMGIIKVLIVDDVLDIVEEMVDMLALADIRALGANTIDEAIAALAAHPTITLVVSDLRLKEEDGLDILDRVANEESLAERGLRYVFMSGDTENMAWSPAEAGHILLDKPISPRLLIATIRGLLDEDGAKG